MKGRVILLGMPSDRPSQAALIVDGRVEDLLLDPLPGDSTPRHEEICWARVDRPAPKLGGAFVKLTPSTQGFLREAGGLSEGAGVLVQVAGYPEPGKAAPVTNRLLFKGRLLIHTPDAPGINVSRQIKDEDERARLIAAVADWKPADDGELDLEEAEMHRSGGYIVRSAARGVGNAELQAEIDWLLARRSVLNVKTRSVEPGTVGESSFGMLAALREWADPLPSSIECDTRAFSFLSVTDDDLGPVNLSGSTTLLALLRKSDHDPFDHFGVWDEIERMKSPRADLPSGGWMAIEATRAMVTVDVNTGDRFGAGAAMTANIEAARELPRQLRLRGLGGQVVIDFAPLKKMHRKKLEETLKTAFRSDPVATTLAGWTPLGNFELQRKRERRPLTELV